MHYYWQSSHLHQLYYMFNLQHLVLDCAELLYLHLLVDSSAVGSRQDIPEGSIGGFVETDAELDELQTVLSTTPWDSQDSTHLKTCRSRILQLLLIELEEKAREPGKKSSSSKVKTDELDSYEALVREAGTLNEHFSFPSANTSVCRLLVNQADASALRKIS